MREEAQREEGREGIRERVGERERGKQAVRE